MSDARMTDALARPRARARTRARTTGGLRLGTAIACVVLLACFAGPLVYRVDPYALNPAHALASPSFAAPFGTDELGRDELARVLAGGAATLLVALPATLIAFVVGALYGLAAGLGPRLLDRTLMRLLDAVLALPSLIVLISFAALVTLNTTTLILLIGLVAWPPLARLVRNETMAQRPRDFVLASRQYGAGFFHIARVHLLRVMGPLLVVNATFLVADSILVLSALSFLGLGVQPPQTSWGQLLESGLTLIDLAPWWLILPPGLAIFASLLSASLIGQGLLARNRR